MKNPWHSGRIIYAMSSYFGWWNNRMMTEFEISGSKADLVFISKAGYATEIEIKISLADWNADQKKAHWSIDRKYVARFFYAIPETLEHKIPDWVPEHVGILVVFERPYGSWDGVRLVRDAQRRKCQKVPQLMIDRMIHNCYYRYWRLQTNLLGHQLGKQRSERHNGTSGN